jgi:hypothetical protein
MLSGECLSLDLRPRGHERRRVNPVQSWASWEDERYESFEDRLAPGIDVVALASLALLPPPHVPRRRTCATRSVR